MFVRRMLRRMLLGRGLARGRGAGPIERSSLIGTARSAQTADIRRQAFLTRGILLLGRSSNSRPRCLSVQPMCRQTGTSFRRHDFSKRRHAIGSSVVVHGGKNVCVCSCRLSYNMHRLLKILGPLHSAPQSESNKCFFLAAVVLYMRQNIASLR